MKEDRFQFVIQKEKKNKTIKPISLKRAIGSFFEQQTLIT